MAERQQRRTGAEGMLTRISFEPSDTLRARVQDLREDGVIDTPRFHATGAVVLDRKKFVGRAYNEQLDTVDAILRESASEPFRAERAQISIIEARQGPIARLAFFPDEETAVRLNRIVASLEAVRGRIDLEVERKNNLIICQFAASTLVKNEKKLDRATAKLDAALATPGTNFELIPMLGGKEVTMKTL